MAKERVLALFKFGERKCMEELLHEGHVYMNTLSYFIKREATDIARSDKYEATSFWMQPDRAKLSVEIKGVFQEIPGLIGPMTWRLDEDLKANVYCLHAVQPHDRPEAIDPKNFEF